MRRRHYANSSAQKLWKCWKRSSIQEKNMKHYLNDEQMVRDRMGEITRMVERRRLARLTQVYQPGLGAHVLASLGGWMVAEGTRLTKRYEEANRDVDRRGTKKAAL